MADPTNSITLVQKRYPIFFFTKINFLSGLSWYIMPPKKVDKVIVKAEALQPSEYLEPETLKLKSEQAFAHFVPWREKNTFGRAMA